jgi:hypothetical protein
MENKAKLLMFDTWLLTLPRIRKKIPTYGEGETMDAIWNRLPSVSKEYWMEKFA